jgi:hypothetical protein
VHVPALLSSGTRRRHTRKPVLPLGVVLRATELRTPVPLAVTALVVVLSFPDGRIERIGPVTLQPALPVLLLVPLLLATGCALAHATWRSPVVQRNRRVLLARGLSYGTALVTSLGIVLLGGALAEDDLGGGVLRNLLWMTGLALATAALAGVVYAWAPVVTITAAGILSSPGDDPWTLNGMLFHPQATAGQLTVAAVLCAAGFALAVADPVSRGYLRSVGT